MYKFFSILLIAAVANISSSKAEVVIDSIGIENLNGKKLIIHKIVAHDTYYSVARRYNVSPKEIMRFNDNKYLSIGTIIKVPTSVNFNDTKTTSASPASSPGPNPPASQQIEHVVKAKENLNQLARKYGTTVNEIKRINSLSSSNLHIGQVLLMPVQTNDTAETVQTAPAPSSVSSTPVKADTSKPGAVQPDKPVSGNVQKPAAVPTQNSRSNPAANGASSSASNPGPNSAADEAFLEHTVRSNETMYSIATTYHMTMDQLKAKNNITGNSLRVGQKLLIRGQYPQVPEQGASVPLATGDTTLKDPSLRGAPSKYGLNQVDEKGTAAWITDPDLDPSKMLVLHRSAPIGTIVKVTNPMTNRSTFAKVVGKFTENESTKDVIIVMTKAVAESIGAIDKRFFCNLTYSGQDVEQQ
jgi:LysM repeat protein